RRAFDAAAKDPALLAESQKIRFDVEPVDGETVQRLVNELYETPRPMIERAQWALTTREKRQRASQSDDGRPCGRPSARLQPTPRLHIRARRSVLSRCEPGPPACTAHC